jgi:hypothetical protein
MELDELKTSFKIAMERGISPLTTTILNASLQAGAQPVLQKIRRNIWLEFVVFVISMSAAVYYWFNYPSLLIRLFCSAVILCSLAFCICLYSLYRNIIQYETAPGTIRDGLVRIIAILKKFTRFYFTITMWLLPVIYAFGLISGYLDIAEKGLLPQFRWSNTMLLYTVGFLAGWTFFTWFFAKWYIKKLYGNYLHLLEQRLKDVENG